MTAVPARYVSRVREVEAIQWAVERDCEAICEFTGLPHASFEEELDHSKLHIPAEPDTVTAVRGDWVVRCEDGRYEVYMDGDFRRAFRPADDAEPQQTSALQHLRNLYSQARGERNGDDLDKYLDESADRPDFVAAFIAAELRAGQEAQRLLAEMSGGLKDSGYVVVSRADLTAYLNRRTGNLSDEVDVRNRLLAAAGIEG